MPVQIDNSNFSGVGRMFARNNVTALYDRQKGADNPVEDALQGVDRLELSQWAPRPLGSSLFTDSLKTAQSLTNGSTLSEQDMGRLREDKVFSAVTALAAMGMEDADRLPRAWPGGLPAPSSAELAEARRRLAQRLRMDTATEAASEPALQQQRRELYDKIRSTDFSSFTAAAGMESAK